MECYQSRRTEALKREQLVPLLAESVAELSSFSWSAEIAWLLRSSRVSAAVSAEESSGAARAQLEALRRPRMVTREICMMGGGWWLAGRMTSWLKRKDAHHHHGWHAPYKFHDG